MNAMVVKNSEPIFSNPWAFLSVYLENKKKYLF